MAGSGKPTVAIADASYVLAFLMPDERVGEVDHTFREYASGRVSLIAPSLLSFEVLNGLRAGVLTKRIASDDGLKLATLFIELNIALQDSPSIDVYTTSIKHDISVYDGAYVTLARHEHAPLLTLDRKLHKIMKF